jgi:hypothetical protein
MLYDIFVSKPTTQTSRQSEFTSKLEEILEARDFNIRSLGTSDFSNVAPLLKIQKIMDDCEGALILGLKQLNINKGILKQNTKSERKIINNDLPTPWNHIEAGIAFALKIPLLIIKEEGIEGGIFDMGSSDRFIHQINIDDELDKYFQSK